MAVKAIILAAGSGTRLGNSSPKCLTRLSNNRTILECQLEVLSHYLGLDNILVVVGYKKESIMEAFPGLTFVYNERFNVTNTAKSLLKGLKKVIGNDVVWLNGDVVFEKKVIEKILSEAKNKISCMCVNKGHVGTEEIKYMLDDKGLIRKVSKDLPAGLGEAVGINFIKGHYVELLIECLEECGDGDYFERGIELAIQKGLKVYPVDISELFCWEVDFPGDLDYVNRRLSSELLSAK